MTFNDIGLLPELLRAVHEAGYTSPTPIQAQAIPIVLSGQDMMGGAQTGTGKTAGFTLPLLQRLARHASSSPSPAKHPVRALILVPTRELALQVHDSVKTYSKYIPLRSVCIYGGVDIKPQIVELREGREIVVATPGRLLDHIEQKSFNFSQVEMLVLDEADRMLDMGFIPDIRRILSLLPASRQSLLFSATFSAEIKKLADTMLKSPQLIEVARSNAINDTITHRLHPVDTSNKRHLLLHLLKEGGLSQVLVFVGTKIGAGQLTTWLERQGVSASAIHGDKNQQQRSEALDAFKAGTIQVLVATDVAARGIDIDDLPHVINYELPHTAEDYVHRIGRTGRAGKKGDATSLVAPEEKGRLDDIEKLIKFKIQQVVVEQFAPGKVVPSHSREDKPAHGRHPERHDKSERSSTAIGHGPRTSIRMPGAASHVPKVAADGFDFSKPYQAKSTAVDTASDRPENLPSGTLAPHGQTAKQEAVPRRNIRPVAALLGGWLKK